MLRIDVRAARRLALARAGLLKPEWSGMPRRATGAGKRARDAALAVMERFGYLQLDTVSVAGARSHVIVLLSRVEGMVPALGEQLLQPGQPVFEYWGHEASWLPLVLYPVFGFRRRDFRRHPWWGDVVGEHPRMAEDLRRRIRDEGPIRSLDMEGAGSRGWWDLKTMRRVAAALWSSGELAIRSRNNFQRSFDLTERVIPEPLREQRVAQDEALQALLLKALDGHGWATTGTLAATWRLVNKRRPVAQALAQLRERGEIVECVLSVDGSRDTPGWIRPADLELAARLASVRPRRESGVLLSPFDPVLWDRNRVACLFGFDQRLEIFKPAAQRRFGYYCLPVLAGERLVARFDLKAERRGQRLAVLSAHFEDADQRGAVAAADLEAARSALARYAAALDLHIGRWRAPAVRRAGR